MTAELAARIEKATARYGGFASTHEAMGVALEEWDEFRDAVKSNDLDEIRKEALDLAAVLVRLAGQIESFDGKFANRSGK